VKAKPHILGLAAIALAFVLTTLPGIDFAAHDIRMLQTFSLDEAAFASQVREMADSGSLAVDGFIYGSLYSYLGLLLVTLWGAVAEVTDTTIILALRLISILAALVTAYFAFRTAEAIYNEEAGIGAAALALSTPLIFRWTLEIHPDILQLCFLSMALYFAVTLTRKVDWKTASLAGLCAGLAMGTKYGGGFIMPTIALALFLGTPGGVGRAIRTSDVWLAGMASLVAFSAAYAITNPCAIANIGNLMEDLSFAGRIVSDAEGNARSWLWSLYTPENAAIISLALPVGIHILIRKQWTSSIGILCVLFWVFTYVTFLLVNVRFIAGQYLLPIIPACAIVISSIVAKFREDARPAWAKWGAIGFLVVAQAWYATSTFVARTIDELENPVIAAGMWLSESYPDDTTIVYDTYAYIPSKFELSETYFGLSYPVIRTLNPDLVITRSSVIDRYHAPDQSEHFRLADNTGERSDFLYLDPQRYKDIHYTYQYLKADLTAYERVKDFDVVTVYARKDRALLPDKTDKWESALVDQRGEGVVPNAAASAYRAFGDAHAAAGNWPQAEIQYAKAIKLQPGAVYTRYQYVLALAHQGNFDVAEKLLEETVETFGKKAELYLKLGWDYCTMGEFDRSRKLSGRAGKVAPDLPFPQYNIALTFLMEGRTEDARSAYRRALRRHPLPSSTANLLRSMIQDQTLKGAQRDVAESVLSSGKP